MTEKALPPGIIRLTPEMLDPEGSLATSIRRNRARSEDAETLREGPGWQGIIEGFCPVQGWGNVDGLNWYFRARHESWSFEVWREPFGPDGALPDPDPICAFGGEYGETAHAASWMRYSHAWQLIEACIAKGRAWGWENPK